MKTRLICLALCLLFILSAGLTGCKQKTRDDNLETIIEESSADNKTLSLWLVTKNELSESVKSSVNQAVNEITQAKFNTYLFINFLTEDEYYNTVSDEIRAYENSKNNFSTAGVEFTAGVQEGDTWYVTLNGEKLYALPEGQRMGRRENGEWYIAVGKNRFEKRYPLIKAHQVDLVYIGDLDETMDGETMYTEFVGNNWLTSLDSELSSSSKKIKEYLPATLLEAAKIAKNTYAIPNNRELGEYTFMLLDKELMEETFMSGIYNQGKIDGFFNSYIYSYLQAVRAKNGNNQPLVDASFAYCLDLLAHYWSIDPETYQAQNDMFSILGYNYTDPAKLSKGETVLSFDSLFASETFRENYTKINQLDMDGFFKNSEEETCENPAIRFETGNYARYEELLASVENDDAEDAYYPVIVKYPTVDADEVFHSMFGVCSYSVDLAASMRILTYMNTNADFRNLLQYGVEGEHYKLVGENETVVERLEDEEHNILYMMDIYKTGNAFIAYPDPALNMDASVWENAKLHNLDLKLDPMLGFDFATLVKNSSQSTAEAPKVGSTGYVYSYEYGYSKDVASQNALLKKWIDQSDAAGAGVYVLHTGVVEGQNFNGKIYYYNNAISGAKVTVSDSSETKELTVNYTGTAGNGSDITVITFTGKRGSSDLRFLSTVNGAAAETVVTYQNSLLSFDFNNTDHYTVDFDYGVSMAMVLENKVIWNWIEDVVEDGAEYAVATYEADGEYTFVVYVPKITKQYTVKFQPTVNGNELNLNVDFKNTDAALGKSDLKYAIFTVTAEIEAPMTAAKLNLNLNGKAVTAEDMDVLESDPKFAIAGKLDVELVKYINDVNNNVNEILAAFKATGDKDAFKKLVNYLGELLTVQSLDIISSGKAAKPTLANDATYFFGADATADEIAAYTMLSDFVSPIRADQFYRALLCATSKTEVGHKVFDESGEKLIDTKSITQIYGEDHLAAAETYVYYSSPYALYFAWLKENGYAK